MDWFFLTLRYTLTAIPFAFAMLFALAGFWALIAATSRVTAGAWVVGGAFLIETIFVAAPIIPAGIQLSSNDLAFALLAVALGARILFYGFPRGQTAYGLWLAFGVLFFFSFGQGLAMFGRSAGVEARPNFYFWMAGLYFASFSYPPDTMRKLWRIAQWTAWLVAAIVVYRWVGLKFGFVSARLVEFAGASSEFRVVGSNPTFYLSVFGVAYFALWLRESRRMLLLGSLVMLGLVLVLQHRSVWVATAGALALVAWHQRAAVARKAMTITGMVLVMLAAVTLLMALNPSNRLVETLVKSTVSVTESRGTHTDRLEGWQALLGDYASYSPQEWLLGKPYGTGYERYSGGRLETYSPHNFYVQLLLRIGAIGVLLLLWVHFSLRSRLLRVASRGANETLYTVFLAIMVANLLYFIPYQGFYLQGAFYGMLIGYLATRIEPVPVYAPLPSSPHAI